MFVGLVFGSGGGTGRGMGVGKKIIYFSGTGGKAVKAGRRGKTGRRMVFEK